MADPTGCGEGFSYVKVPNKPTQQKVGATPPRVLHRRVGSRVRTLILFVSSGRQRAATGEEDGDGNGRRPEEALSEERQAAAAQVRRSRGGSRNLL